jgi:NAD(P)-dependent dehydrogenase (short-subunit alcohol dehydrogenase family)
MKDLIGKTVLVTGAASGIGAAHAKVFATAGVNVVITDVSDINGEQLAASLREQGCHAVFFHLDVSDMKQWVAAVNFAKDKFGGVDFLVNNAGIYTPASVLDETVEGWQRMIDINQSGVLYGIKAVLPGMIERQAGAIVNISSLFGIIGGAGSLSYCATKGAVRMMTKSAALDVVKDNIRINSIHPGQIDTPIVANLTPEMDRAIKARIPMGRLGRPEEIANVSLFLCSDMSSYITGEEISVDGGWNAN